MNNDKQTDRGTGKGKVKQLKFKKLRFVHRYWGWRYLTARLQSKWKKSFEEFGFDGGAVVSCKESCEHHGDAYARLIGMFHGIGKLTENKRLI